MGSGYGAILEIRGLNPVIEFFYLPSTVFEETKIQKKRPRMVQF